MPEFLDLVDEEDKVIGRALRSEVHAKGLLHREIHVWYVVPGGGVVFQKRAEDKETFPGLLDATVGGHVDPGMTYEQAALMEMREETGIDVPFEKLHFIEKRRSDAFDQVTQRNNNCFRTAYAFILESDPATLKVEEGKGAGFVTIPFELLFNPTDGLRKQVIHSHLSPDRHNLYRKLQDLVR